MYKKVTEADIEEFEANYRGSDTERNDLIELYKKLEGNMNKYFSLLEHLMRLFCCMICSDLVLDSHRFKDMIDEAVSAGELNSTKAYEKWAERVSKTKPPTSPLRRRKKSKKNSVDLYAIIAVANARKGKIDSMFSSLVQKYGGPESAPEPSEEEFEAARRKLESQRTSK
ncbi:Chaperone protein dnaJ 6 [Orobanche minor]